MKIITSILLFIYFSIVCFSQQAELIIEYGNKSELKGITKIFIFTGPQLEARENIVKQIKKELPELIIAENVNGAEIALVFGDASNERVIGNAQTGPMYQ